MLIVPVGSTEQHGPHLPLDTDTRIAAAVSHALVEHLDDASPGDWVVAPPVHYGASGEHEGFPGTVSIGTAALRSLLLEYGRSALSWASRLVFVNGHGECGGAGRCGGPVAPGEPRRRLGPVHRRGRRHTRDIPKHLYCYIFRPAMSGLTAWLPGTPPRWPSSCRPCAVAGSLPSAKSGCWVTRQPPRLPRGERIFAEMVNGCAGRIRRWQPDRNGLLT